MGVAKGEERVRDEMGEGKKGDAVAEKDVGEKMDVVGMDERAFAYP